MKLLIGILVFIFNLAPCYASRQDAIKKLESLGVLKNPLEFKVQTKPYSEIYKKDRSFYLETFVVVPMNFKKSLPVVREFSTYNNWVLKDINTRRFGEKGSYFIDILSLDYLKRLNSFDVAVKMNKILSGHYRMQLAIIDELDKEKEPNFTLRMKSPSKLAKHVEGTFYFIIPDDKKDYYIVYFKGWSTVNWTIYTFLPISLVRSELMERVQTLLENIQFKVENSKI